MTESDSSPGSDRERRLQEALQRERDKRGALEAQVEKLQTQVEAERIKAQRLASRRSVRLALRVANLGKPIVHAARRLRGQQEEGLPVASPVDVVAAMRRLRPEKGPTQGPLVSLVVLNRDGADHLHRLLSGLRDTTVYRSFEVIVVDNASTDGSLDVLHEDWGFPIQIIENEANVSFSRGCNQGAALAGGKYVLLLNNDIAPITPGWLGAMVSDLETKPDRGAVGALLVYPERPGYVSKDPNDGGDLTIQHRGIRLQRRRNATEQTTVPWAYNMGVGEDPTHPALTATVEVPAVTAACMLIRTSLLHDLGGFDEGFVYGMEDVDLSLRVRGASFTVAVVGTAALFHHEFGTQSRITAARKRSQGLANVQHFSEKWGAKLSRLLQLESLQPDTHALSQNPAPKVAITLTRDDPNAGWGDWYTAHELGDALGKAGYRITYAERYRDRWYSLDDDIAAVIALIDGFDVRRAPPDALTIAWVRNWTDRWIEQPWFGESDIYIPSSRVSAKLLEGAGVAVTDVVPLATNDARFYQRPPNPAYTNDVAITCNYWKAARPGIEEMIVRPGETVSIYGQGWEDVPRLSRYVRGGLPYDELVEVYSSAKIVIDETATPTLPYGAVNSRVFDAAACGALVITNNKIGSDELFDGALPVYSDAAEQRAILDKYLADDTLRSAAARALQRTVLEHHTYAQRATEIPGAAREMLLRPRIALKVGAPDEASAQLWGDTHFANALAAALRRHGGLPQIHLLEDWEQPASQCVDVVVHIRGLGTYVPKPAHKNILWIISHPEEVTAEECNGYDVVLVASQVFAAALRDRVAVPVEVMFQATDPDRFYPDPNPELRHELLFVGNSRGQRRMAVEAALDIGAPLTVYGHGWDDMLPPETRAGQHFPNERLGALYSSADVTLSDHWPEMAEQGFVSNRVFDIIASGGLVFTDRVAGIEQLFGNLIPMFSTPEELADLLADRKSNSKHYQARMAEARDIVQRQHTFDARAGRLMEIVDELGWEPATSLG